MPQQTVESTALGERVEVSTEVAPTTAVATAMKEVEAMVLLARRFRRNEDEAFLKIMKALDRFSLADMASYEYPRGTARISGPSVYLMREMARCWGNMLWGHTIVAEDDETVIIRCHAWDLETNERRFADVSVRKLIQRKFEEVDDNNRKVTVTRWVRPDTRDLRELVNNMAAREERNCIKHILPSDLVEDAVKHAAETVEKGVKEDPEAAKKALVLGFGKLNVTPRMVEGLLGHPLEEASPAELTDLRRIWKTIRNGEKTWLDFAPDQRQEAASAAAASKTQAKSDETKEKLKKTSSSGRKRQAKPPTSDAGPTKVTAQDVQKVVDRRQEAKRQEVTELPDPAEAEDGQVVLYKGEEYIFVFSRSAWKSKAVIEKELAAEAEAKAKAADENQPETGSEDPGKAEEGISALSGFDWGGQ